MPDWIAATGLLAKVSFGLARVWDRWRRRLIYELRFDQYAVQGMAEMNIRIKNSGDFTVTIDRTTSCPPFGIVVGSNGAHIAYSTQHTITTPPTVKTSVDYRIVIEPGKEERRRLVLWAANNPDSARMQLYALRNSRVLPKHRKLPLSTPLPPKQ